MLQLFRTGSARLASAFGRRQAGSVAVLVWTRRSADACLSRSREAVVLRSLRIRRTGCGRRPGWMEFSQRAKNCLIPLQEWHVTQFARSSGAAKVIGIHAPPLGPSDQWSDSDLSERTKVFKRSEDSRMRKPDGTITKGREPLAMRGRAQGGTNGRRGSVRIDRRASRLVHPERWGRRGPGYNWSSQVTYRHGCCSPTRRPPTARRGC